MKKLAHSIARVSSRFRIEFRKQTRLAIAAAIGFLIAYAWKDYILTLSKDLFTRLSITMPHMSNFLAALVLTLIGVILIMISSKFLE